MPKNCLVLSKSKGLCRHLSGGRRTVNCFLGCFLERTAVGTKMAGKRICLVGAGPSGMSILYNADKLRKEGRDVPEIVCFEKQADWGGLWNYTWRTGLDEYGEAVHSSMYRHLWSNGPKEALEFPDYTFDDHFGKAIPSFPPREVLFDYLKGRWNKGEKLRDSIKFSHIVRNVEYDEASEMFTVVAKNMVDDKVLAPEKFDYVIVASGHYSTPHVPTFPGIDNFPGTVLHAHDFRDGEAFKGKRLLLVGASYSAEDIAIQCIKYGASSVICTWRTKPMGFNWPPEIAERPLLTKFDGSTCHFKDGSSAQVDVVMLCTGYLISYPFLSDSLRLRGPNILYPAGLYKGIVWTSYGNAKLLYIGAQDQYYTFTMFDIQALWAMKYILKEISAPDRESMEKDWKKWVERNKKLKNCHDDINFQTDYVIDLAKDCQYSHDLDVASMLHEWEHHKEIDILTYRDQSFTSKFTGSKAPLLKTKFMHAFDDSIKSFIN